MARILYSLLLYILSPIVFLHLWLRGNKAPAYRQRWGERLGFYKQPIQTNSIVIHCASVGELMAASQLIKKLTEKHTITLTCNTPTGSAEIIKQFGNNVQHIYLPLDFPGSVKRFLNTFKPKAVVILETELWPNLIIKSQQAAIPVTIINARLSEKSQRGYQKVAPLTHAMMKHISLLAAHNQTDANRFMALGLDKAKCVVTGSIKFDIQITQDVTRAIDKLTPQLAQHSFVWVAGSTHPGEHEQVIAAHQALCQNVPDALLIIAPRHPEQFQAVANLLANSDLSFSQRSQQAHQGENVLLADTMGEMLTFFGAAHCAFIGGSLIERGGHNPLEAAAFRIPVITGASFTNFLHVYPQLLKEEACICVNNEAELRSQLIELSQSERKRSTLGENAFAILEQNKGALTRTITEIENTLK